MESRSHLRRSRGRGTAGPAAGTDDRGSVLAFLAEHRFATRSHIEQLLGIGDRAARRLLTALESERLILIDRPLGRLGPCYRINRRGLRAIESRLSPPRPVDLATYAHDIGVASLHIAAKAGAFGAVDDVISERHMRSYDASEDRLGQLGGPGPPHGVRLFGFGPGGREKLHYPDLALVDRAGHRIAVELELTPKGRRRRERILEAYAGDRRFDAVLYLVERPDVAHLVRRSAERLGIGRLVHVQPFRDVPARPAGVDRRDRDRTRSPRGAER